MGERRRRAVDRRREISRAYKERKQRGCVYAITNARTGRYLIGYAADVASMRNRFQFAATTGSAVDPRLRQDWEAYGAAAFSLDVLEELEQRPDQTRADFMEDLKALAELVRAQRDPALAY